MEYENIKRKDNKKTIWIVAMAIVSLIAIGGIVVAYKQYDQKQIYIAQAIQDKSNREKLVMESYDRIESNLARISQYENMIKGNMTDAESNSTLSPEERIQNEISMIEQLLNENNQLIENLHGQINEKDARLASYEKTVKDLKGRIEEYKQSVDVLVAEKEALQQSLTVTSQARDQLQQEVGNLNTEVAQKSNVIEEQNAQLVEKERNLHTAYYTVGTYKALRDKNVLEKEGGFLGINREKTLANGLDNQKFTEIDTRAVSEIPVDAKRCEIVTEQDPATYTMVYKNDKVAAIKITNPDKFWGKSKYLVIVTNEASNGEVAASR